MITAGCDVGSLTAKLVIMDDNKILTQSIARVNARPAESAKEVMLKALANIDLEWADVTYSVGTGYGKDQISFANKLESEISCHARGARWSVPSCRTVIDIGGQDSKAIRLDKKGKVIRYAYNDKCASGTGRFLEIMAEALEIKLADMGDISKKASENISISNQCVIFAETELVSLVNEGKEVPDIIHGLHRAMANRVASLAMGIGVGNDVVMTGGVAKNSGVFKALAESLNVDLKSTKSIDPQIAGALGAALLAGCYCK